MRFYFEGQLYEISFHRARRTVRVYDPSTNTYEEELSTHPYTTVNIYKVQVGVNKHLWPLAWTHTVGVHREDHYSTSKGRIHALRAIGADKTPAFRQALWTGYNNRFIKLREPIQ